MDQLSNRIPVNIEDEMKRSYMDYAMSVIIGRALPDVRDGLKPANRRVLFAMRQMGLVSNRAHRKCAKIVGEVIGNYHPHGDASAYDTLVRDWDGRDGRFRVVLAPDWTPACSDDLYRLCRRKADEDGTGIVSHVLETRSEMMWNLETYGMPALQRLKNLGVLAPDMTCAHFVWVSDAELSIFADSGAVASNNPGSNLRLSSGICRTRDIMATGGRVAFGTDGISFSDTEDMFAELRLACYLQRFPRDFDVVRLDSEEVFRAAAVNGARAIRQEEGLGSLTEGKLADLLIVDSRRILFPPGRYESEPILNVILDRAQAVDLQHVMIDGELVMRDRVITTIDEAAVMNRVAEAVEKRIYRLSPEVKRWIELGDAVMPNVVDFYKRWYSIPGEPAHTYNTR